MIHFSIASAYAELENKRGTSTILTVQVWETGTTLTCKEKTNRWLVVINT